MSTIKNNYRTRGTARQAEWKGRSLAEAAEHYRGRARAKNTSRTYGAAVKQYLAFCQERGFQVLPGDAEALVQFLVFIALEGASMATVRTRFFGIRRYYRDQVGRNNVTHLDRVVDCLNGLQREYGQPPVQAPALTATHIKQILRKLPRCGGKLTIGALRDRALLLVMYAGAFRRSEASGLLRQDVVFEETGMRIFLRKSKTDQYAEGVDVGIGRGRYKYTCPVLALQTWFEATPGEEYVFQRVERWGLVRKGGLSDTSISRIVRDMAAKAGVDWELFSAHSLRAGITTDLNEAGMSTAMVQERTRHKSAQMVPRYHRPGTVLANNFTRRVGL